MSASPKGRQRSKTQEYAESCREHYGEYYLAVHPGFHYVPYQQELIAPELEDIESGENDRLMILMHPGASKTDLCTAGFAPWFVGRDPVRMVLIVSYGDKPAAEFGEKIKDGMTQPNYRLIFPWSKLSAGNQSKTLFRTTMGGRIYTAGWEGAIARIRVDLVIIDDPLKNLTEATSDRVVQSRVDAFNSVVKDRLKPGGRIMVCTNRWATRDFVGRVLEREPERWRVLTVDAEPDPTDPNRRYLEPDTTYLWESYLHRERYEEKKLDSYIWMITWRQKPERAEPRRFLRKWLQTYLIEKRPKPGRLHAVLICDPALAKHKRADRTSIMVLGGYRENKLFLLDWVLDRLDPEQRSRAICKMIEYWDVDSVLYEEVGLSSDSFYLNRDMERMGLGGVVVYPVGRSGVRHLISKENRIWETVADFRLGRIVLPAVLADVKLEDGTVIQKPRPRFMYKQVDGREVDLMAYFVEEEYVKYNGDKSVAHDEGLDTISRIHDPEFQMTYLDEDEGGRDDEDERDSGRGQFAGAEGGGAGSWFSRL